MSNQLPRAPSPSASNRATSTEPKQEPVLSSYASVSSSSSSAPSATLPTPSTAKQCIASFWCQISRTEYLMQDIDPAYATSLLWCFCFISGFINAVPFTAVLLWCGFQTGNTVQLAVAIGRFLSSNNTNFTFEVADQQALISLLSYLGGGYLGRYGDRMGSNRRVWLMTSTLMQALLTMAAALTIWKSSEPSVAGLRGEDAWTNALSFVALGFASASQGLQGVMAKRINSHFGATVVLTTLWCELIADPDLFRCRYVKSRDHRVSAVLAFVLGGVIGRGILDQTGSAAVFGVGTGLRVLIALCWLFVPAKK